MTMQCPTCYAPMHFSTDVGSWHCQCGTTITIRIFTSTTTNDLVFYPNHKCALTPKPKVPKAFYDAFKEVDFEL